MGLALLEQAVLGLAVRVLLLLHVSAHLRVQEQCAVEPVCGHWVLLESYVGDGMLEHCGRRKGRALIHGYWMSVRRMGRCGTTPTQGGSVGGRKQVNKALHTCTSWYAYAAMFGSSIDTLVPRALLRMYRLH